MKDLENTKNEEKVDLSNLEKKPNRKGYINKDEILNFKIDLENLSVDEIIKKY